MKCRYARRDHSFCPECPDLMSAECPKVGFDCDLCSVDCLCKVENTPEREKAYWVWRMEHQHDQALRNKRNMVIRTKKALRSLGRTCSVCGVVITDKNKSGCCRKHVGGKGQVGV